MLAIRKRIAGSDRKASDELDFIAAQIKRRGLHPTPRQTWALAPSAPQRCSHELLEGIAALSRQHGLPVFTHVYETRVQAAAARKDPSAPSLLDVLARAGLMPANIDPDHAVLYPGHLYSPEPSQSMGDTRAHNFVYRLKTPEQWMTMFGG